MQCASVHRVGASLESFELVGKRADGWQHEFQR